jgi:hypothetical protein
LPSNFDSVSRIGATEVCASLRNSSELLFSAAAERALKASDSAVLASSSSLSFCSNPLRSASMVAASASLSRVISRIVRCCCARPRLRASLLQVGDAGRQRLEGGAPARFVAQLLERRVALPLALGRLLARVVELLLGLLGGARAEEPARRSAYGEPEQ